MTSSEHQSLCSAIRPPCPQEHCRSTGLLSQCQMALDSCTLGALFPSLSFVTLCCCQCPDSPLRMHCLHFACTQEWLWPSSSMDRGTACSATQMPLCRALIQRSSSLPASKSSPGLPEGSWGGCKSDFLDVETQLAGQGAWPSLPSVPRHFSFSWRCGDLGLNTLLPQVLSYQALL